MSRSSAIDIQELPTELDGDLRELLESLGSLGNAPGWAGMFVQRKAHGLDGRRALEGFLSTYVNEVHGALELPAVLRAWHYAENGFSRDLIDLDRELSHASVLKPFKAASCAVGRRQLSKLRSLRDQRVVQRYLRAVEEGRAAGWHTVVYGVLLSIYSIPLRTGLNHLALQTIGGMIFSATSSLKLPLSQCAELAQEYGESLPLLTSRLLKESKLLNGDTVPDALVVVR